LQIESRGLTRRFGRVEALRGVDLAIPAGRRIGLVGPNGSGKSTLIRVLMGLLHHGGEVRVGGHDPRRERVAIARRLAYVPQVPPSLAATVAELAAAVHRLRGLDPKRLREHAEELGLRWDAIAEVPFRGLSGGMKQKLLIALALASGADLVILDEPTASLDAGTRETFFRMFERMPASTTLLLCSHRLDEMRHLVDHVVSLEEGRVRFDGPAADYLRERALSVIEVRLRNGSESDWLRELGFHAGQSGWWRQTVNQGRKLELLPELARDLGGRLDNLHVRDLESVEVEAHEELP
jgi:ABC-2 type transport system ATP-binding protein